MTFSKKLSGGITLATKLQTITELAKNRTLELTKDVENWTGFLNSVSWLYKYRFHEQVMIYTQRPDATACAPISE